MPSPLKLPLALVRGGLAPLKAALTEALAAGGTVEIDCEAATRIDAAGAQLLLAFSLEAARLSRPVRWHAVGSPVEAALIALGMPALLASGPGPDRP